MSCTTTSGDWPRGRRELLTEGKFQTGDQPSSAAGNDACADPGDDQEEERKEDEEEEEEEEDRVTVEAGWKHANGRPAGTYFRFELSAWAEGFGDELTEGTVYRNVEQWRDGAKIWTGTIKVWPSGTATTGAWPRGRREPLTKAEGKFETGDQLSPAAANDAGAAPGEGGSSFPAWSWDHVRNMCTVRRTDKYSDAQIRALARQDVVMLEKANGFRTYGSIEQGTLAAAKRIKALNPRCKILFYHNAMVHYTGFNFKYAAYKSFKNKWLMTYKNGKKYKWMKKYHSYDHSNLEFREWWVQRALDMCAHAEIDGVFIDAIIKAELASLPVKNHAKYYRETADDLKGRLPAGKLLIGNALRLGRGQGHGLTHLEYLDGSYLEQWYTSNAGPRKLMGTLKLMSKALGQDKIIMLKTEPTKINRSTLSSLSSLDERYNYIGEPQFINFTLAYFLLVVEPYAYYSYRTGVDANPKRKECFDNTKFEAVMRSLGAPVSGYVKVKTDRYSREFERVVVHVNLQTHQAALLVKDEQGAIVPPKVPDPDTSPVTIEADLEHYSGRAVGTYFSFAVSAWSRVFDKAVTAGTFQHAVDQWRDGRLVWTGDVLVWPPTSKTDRPHGRTEPWSAGQFRTGDRLAPRPPGRATVTAADWAHGNGRVAGTYFRFDLADWSEVLGVDVTADGTVRGVDLWRDGVRVWTGDVKVWSRGSVTNWPHGRAEPWIPGHFQTWDQLSPGGGGNRVAGRVVGESE